MNEDESIDESEVMACRGPPWREGLFWHAAAPGAPVASAEQRYSTGVYPGRVHPPLPVPRVTPSVLYMAVLTSASGYTLGLGQS